MSLDPGLDDARRKDASDPLAAWRERFFKPPGSIYMDGNSLGLMSRDANESLERAIHDWKSLAIDGWMGGSPPWFDYAERIGATMAPLVGADADEVVVAASTTVNLHALVATFFTPTRTRRKILATSLDFPSDIYAIQSQLRLRGCDPDADLVRVAPRAGQRFVEEDDLIAAMTDDVALALLPGVLYRSGQLLDVGRLAQAAQRRGVVLGIDGSHSVGAVPHEFDRSGVDFAFWCTYKYLNGGPGSLAGLYVNRRHFGASPGLAGWWGSDKSKQFDMEHVFTGAGHAGAWQIGTPTLFGLAPLAGALALFTEVGIDRVRAASLAKTDDLIERIRAKGLLELRYGFAIGTPLEHARRGGHVAVEHVEAARIAKALKARGVVPDFRAPNIVRLAPIALYTTYEESLRTVEHLAAIIDQREYERFPKGREAVA